MSVSKKIISTIGIFSLLCSSIQAHDDDLYREKREQKERHIAEVPCDSCRDQSKGGAFSFWRPEYWVYVGLVTAGVAIALTQD